MESRTVVDSFCIGTSTKRVSVTFISRTRSSILILSFHSTTTICRPVRHDENSMTVAMNRKMATVVAKEIFVPFMVSTP